MQLCRANQLILISIFLLFSYALALNTEAQAHRHINTSALRESLFLPDSYKAAQKQDVAAPSDSTPEVKAGQAGTADAVTASAGDATAKGSPKSDDEAPTDKALAAQAVSTKEDMHEHKSKPCHHKEEQPGFGFGSMMGSIIAEAAKDVFGIQQTISDRISTQMQGLFEDIMSGPTLPSILDTLKGPTLPLPLEAEPEVKAEPVEVEVTRVEPAYNVVITSSSSADSSDSKDAGEPVWQQQVVISSSSPEKLQELAGMFEQQLGALGAFGWGRKLKAGRQQ